MSNVTNMFAQLRQSTPAAELDPNKIVFIGYGSNGRLRLMPDGAFIQVGFTAAELEMGKTPTGEPAHCIICSGRIEDPVRRAQFRATMDNLIARNRERTRGGNVTAEQLATYFARIMAEFGFAVEQYRPLESREEVQRQIAERTAGRTRTGSASSQSGSFNFDQLP